MIKDMAQGKPFSVILRFSLPMLLSITFQQIYSIVDSIVAGRFVGEKALAAVGVSYPITMLFIAIASGAGIGCSVIISQIFGAKELSKMKSAITTAMLTLCSMAVILTLVGFIICNPLMHLLKTPTDIFPDAALFLRIYICGLVFLFLYNTANSIYTALGDSKTPLYFLIFSSVLNVVLDLLFVIQFDLGVSGVAWATFIAQGIASVLAVTNLFLRLHKLNIPTEYPVFNFVLLKRMSTIAVPSILQQSFISVGQLFVQGRINSFGSTVVAGYSAALKINMFAIMAFTTLGNAVSSFTAQNIGAGKPKRISEGFKSSIRLGLTLALFTVITILCFNHNLIGLFVEKNSGTNVITVGMNFLKIVAPFYLIISIKLVCDGILRGSGEMAGFMAATFSDLILRVILAFILSVPFGYLGIWWSWPVGWILGTLISVLFYLRVKKRNYLI